MRKEKGRDQDNRGLDNIIKNQLNKKIQIFKIKGDLHS